MGMDLALPAGPTGARGAGRVSAARRSLADAAPPPSHNVLVDVDGLRCEVRSMRSVPHALYSTPSVSHVLATYVQQLIDDFTRSLLLCRPAQRSSSSISSRVIQAESGDPQRQKQLQSTTTTTLCAADLTVDGALSSEDEETYLLLRLCHLHKAELQQQQQQPSESSGGDASAMAGGWRMAGANTGSVAEQLIALFAAADRPCCRHGPNGGAREEDSEQHDAAVLMPPLLSSLLLFKPMLHDMRYLAQHLLLPRHAWQHHQREWVIVYEDVAVTLRDRLSRYRRASMRSRGRDGEVVTNDEDGTEDRDAASILTGMQRLFPASELQHLWHTLWELLGAAWRQRDRLWGAYRYLHGPRRLPPLCLSGQAPCAVPPGVHACPIMREQYEAYIARVHALTASPSHAVPDAPAAPHAEDSCAFGPFTSADIGISARRLYVLRQPLAAVLRTLRVSVPPAGRDPLVTSATAPVGFQYVDDPVPNGQANTPAPTTDAATPLVVPLFDTTNQDAQLAAAAVPYVSPEVYVSLQQEWQRQRRRAASCSALPVVSWPPVHSFSDDVWNAAVVVLEAALSGFCATDASMCHLALPSVHSSGVDLLDERTAMSRSSSSSSVYSGVLLLLTERHVLPRAAAHNFLYAALYHLQVALNKGGCEDVDNHGSIDGAKALRQGSGSGDGTAAAVLPSPTRLAREWVRYLCSAYGPACLKDGGILAEVASKGLCWRRSERWNAFGMAHVTATTASTTAACADGWPSASSFTPLETVGGASGNSRAPAAAAEQHRSTHAGGGPSSPAYLSTPAPPLAEHLSGRHHGPAAFAMPALADTSVGVGTPGDADGGRDAAALSRLPQRLDRTFNALDTPLLRLLSLEHYRAAPEGKAGSAGVSPAGPKLSREAAATVNRPACGAADDAGDLWAVLSSYLRRCTMTAAATGASATPAGKANGAVTEAADADCVDELLRLLFCCLVRTTRCYRVHDGARTAFAGSAACKGDAPVDVEWCQYAAMNHPFFRGVAERGLLTTYMTASCCNGGGGGGEFSDFAFATATLPALNLYVPAAVLLATVREMEATWKVSGVDVCSERVVKQATSLRTLIGDDMRAWEASAAARGGGSGGRMHQQQQQYLLLANPFVDMAATLLPSPVHRARRALDGVLSPIDFDLAAQLDHTHQLRRLLYCDSDDAAGDDRGRGKKGAAAARVRAYLKSLLMPNTERGTDGVDSHVVYSPFYPLPPTLRGEVWGCLLCVPPSACAREALLAHAVHHTAAKPTPHDRQLSVDIPRCHAYHPLLSSSSGSAQLKRILRAWLYLHPEHAYWQGLDSVCAVLLTVSNRDEALVLAQLNALVNRFIAHDEDCERPRASGIGSGAVEVPFQDRSTIPSGDSSLGPPRAGAATSPLPPARKPTMAEQLRRLVVVLRYCDPLLAHHLFDVLGCTPELYAISWLLTLFSHSLPTRKVYLLWDLLFVEDDAACLVVLCAVVIIHKREVLLSTDFSGCLASFSSGASSINVAAAVGDARWLMKAVPPSVLAPPPPVSSDDRKDAQQSLYGCGHDDAGAAIGRPLGSSGDDGSGVAAVALLAVEDVAAALAASAAAISEGADCDREEGSSGPHWFDSGVYLVDVREQPAEKALRDSVLGAISVPLCTAARRKAHASAGSGAALQRREGSDACASAVTDEVGDVDSDAAGAGWGIVEQQERMQEQQRAEQDAAARQVEDAAAAIVRHVGNPAMAAIIPRVWRATKNHAAPPLPPPQPSLLSCPWPVHPIVLKASRAPHVVLLTSGVVDAHELPLAHQLGVKLNACGVHNVSILRGGVASVRRALPELVVRRAPST
ncbi:Rab-GTPase-TBC domain containing protein, putative [Leishmania donovani]|uniref:Rab-GTPase-TBC domain containing protein, putative n=1 Tax=Leishmania donovani TaxID=5661 RepID=A0A451EJB5_LEIDO|nr:Rab-GTPase-TBC domain containing protein, putative [Leishmania donovani]